MADEFEKRVRESVSECQGRLFEAGHKILAFGILLERQGEEAEGFTDLYGLGLVLREVGDDLLKVWRKLDIAGLKTCEQRSQARQDS